MICVWKCVCLGLNWRHTDSRSFIHSFILTFCIHPTSSPLPLLSPLLPDSLVSPLLLPCRQNASRLKFNQLPSFQTIKGPKTWYSIIHPMERLQSQTRSRNNKHRWRYNPMWIQSPDPVQKTNYHITLRASMSEGDSRFGLLVIMSASGKSSTRRRALRLKIAQFRLHATNCWSSRVLQWELRVILFWWLVIFIGN